MNKDAENKACGLNEEQLARARGLVETFLQNGVDLRALDASGTASPAHIAASIPDVHLLRALADADADLDVVDSNGATPAHVIALRIVVEPKAEDCARLLAFRGVSFVEPRADTNAPIEVLLNWPSTAQQWRGWRELNAKREGPKLGLWRMACELYTHRRRLSYCKRFLRDLG